jgi:hypothetical protein
MKSIQTLWIVTFLALASSGSQALAAGNPCGEPAGVYHEEIDGPSATVIREIRRFKNGDHYAYSYLLSVEGLVPQPLPRGEQVYPVSVELNGRSAMTEGQLLCTTASVEELSDGACLDPGSDGSARTFPGLFFYAAHGEQLNAWDVTLNVLNPVTSRWETPSHLRFAQKNLSELSWAD